MSERRSEWIIPILMMCDVSLGLRIQTPTEITEQLATNMVNVYLHVEDRQVLALSVPFSDIERLSIRPVKWLRFVTFAICGVRGDLSAMPNGPPVDYDSISLDHIAEAYYYTPEGNIHRSHICRFANLRPYRGLSSHRPHCNERSNHLL